MTRPTTLGQANDSYSATTTMQVQSALTGTARQPSDTNSTAAVGAKRMAETAARQPAALPQTTRQSVSSGLASGRRRLVGRFRAPPEPQLVVYAYGTTSRGESETNYLANRCGEEALDRCLTRGKGQAVL